MKNNISILKLEYYLGNHLLQECLAVRGILTLPSFLGILAHPSLQEYQGNPLDLEFI